MGEGLAWKPNGTNKEDLPILQMGKSEANSVALVASTWNNQFQIAHGVTRASQST